MALACNARGANLVLWGLRRRAAALNMLKLSHRRTAGNAHSLWATTVEPNFLSIETPSTAWSDIGVKAAVLQY